MIVQTPGVYISEINQLASTIAKTSTAIPVFIGFTEISQTGALKINGMMEFEQFFGKAFTTTFRMVANQPAIPDRRYFLYDSIQLYFQNGGGPCYILSAGTYTAPIVDSGLVKAALESRLNELQHLDEVTLVVVPDSHFQFDDGVHSTVQTLTSADYSSVINNALTTCANLTDKFLLMDYQTTQTTATEQRDAISATTELKHGAVYYPWLIQQRTQNVSFSSLNGSVASGTSIETDFLNVKSDVDGLSANFGGFQTVNSLKKGFTDLKDLATSDSKFWNVIRYLYGLVLKLDQVALLDSTLSNYKNNLIHDISLIRTIKRLYRFKKIAESTVQNAIPLLSAPSSVWFIEPTDTYTNYTDVENDLQLLAGYVAGTTRSELLDDLESGSVVDLQQIYTAISGLFELARYKYDQLEKTLFSTDSAYASIKTSIQQYLKQVPSQGAVVGAYCKNDRDRGVWKSPANMAILGIEKPVVEVSNREQDSLNVDANTGKSINVIRTFTGKGSIIWGARTLAGNDAEWRYVSVRRFFNFAEKSIKKSLESLVFEPNNPRTWVKIKAMVTSFLVEQWKAGALAGTKIEEAFFIEIGPNTTTNAELLAGIINVQIGMAVARPAEFIVVEFSHQTS